MAYLVNQQGLAEILGVNRKTLTMWQREGLPIARETPNGFGNEYDVPMVVAWTIERAKAKGTFESEGDRLYRLQADKLEIELAEMRHRLIPVVELVPTWRALQANAAKVLGAMGA